MSPPNVIRSAFGIFFEYDTPRIVHIRSKKVGIFNRFIQLVIIGYIVGYAIVWKKGYQEFDNVQGAVTTKLKGVAFTNFSDIPGLTRRVWDVSDYVVPPQENSAFFVMTNVVVTPEQTQSSCPEDPKIKEALCTKDDDCIEGEPVTSGNGVRTGDCVPTTFDNGTEINVCKIYAWCPVEIEEVNVTKAPTPALAMSRNFTVFIKNNIEFPKFDVRRRNILGFNTDAELSSCRFDPNDPKNKFCPIFEISKILDIAEVDNFTDIATSGGVILIIITWDCNLDHSEDNCLPEYTFRRLDRGDFKIAKGFNFRYADYYKLDNGTSARTLYKAYGIRFIVSVQGQAGKFDFVPLILNLASGLALLSLATIICDIFVLYLLKARSYYKGKKYLDVKGEDAYEVMDEHPEEEVNARQRRITNHSTESS